MSQFGQSDLGFRPRPRRTVANSATSLAVSDVVAYAAPVGFKTVSTYTTALLTTYTAKMVLSGMILRDPAGASVVDVLPTCTLIAADFPGICSGSSLDFSVKNIADADELITLTVGAGMTAYSGTSLTINRGETANYTLIFAVSATGVVTADLYRVSTAKAELPVAANMIATQATLITNGVTIHSPQGVITTVVATNATATPTLFTLTNTYIRTTSVVKISFEYATGSTGTPVVWIGALSAGSATIIISNATATVLNAALKIHFSILNA